MLTGDNGILNKAGQAKEETVIGEEKESIALAWNSLIGKKVLDGIEVTDLMLEDELNKNEDKTMVGYDDNNNYLVNYKDTKHTYLVNRDGTITLLENAPELVTETIYVTLYSDGTLAFSSNSETDSTKTVYKTYTIGKDDIYNTQEMVPWNNETSRIQRVTFVDEIKPISTAWWFRSCINLTAIDNIENLNTSQVKDMNRMFCGCRKLTSLDLRTFDTKRVTNMRGMFWAYADDGSGVGEGMALTSINVSSFNTKNVIDMSGMFNGCVNVTSLDVSNFDTSNVTNMAAMFSACSKLDNLNILNFDTSNVTDMAMMFRGCQNLTSIDLSSFNTKKVNNTSQMFAGWNISNTYVDNILKTIYVGDLWDMSSVTEDRNMFIRCVKLVGGNGTTYDSSKIDKEYARIDGGPSSSTLGYFTYKANP